MRTHMQGLQVTGEGIGLGIDLCFKYLNPNRRNLLRKVRELYTLSHLDGVHTHRREIDKVALELCKTAERYKKQAGRRYKPKRKTPLKSFDIPFYMLN